jgi:hypothetical protein
MKDNKRRKKMENRHDESSDNRIAIWGNAAARRVYDYRAPSIGVALQSGAAAFATRSETAHSHPVVGRRSSRSWRGARIVGLLTAIWLCPIAQASLPAVKWAFHELGTSTATVGPIFQTKLVKNLSDTRAPERLALLNAAEWEMLARNYNGDLSPVLSEYAPAYLTAYRTAKAKQALPPSTTVFNTLYEIYLDFLTNPAMSLTSRQAWFLAGRYFIGEAGLAYYLGTSWGDELAYLIQTFDPQLWEAIGYDAAEAYNMFGTGANLALQSIATFSPYLNGTEGFSLATGYGPNGEEGTWIVLNDGGDTTAVVGNPAPISFDTGSPAYYGGGKKHKN